MAVNLKSWLYTNKTVLTFKHRLKGVNMGNNKISTHITIDKDLWEIAKVVLPCSRSKFIETQLRNYIDSIDNIEELKNEIKEIKAELLSKEEKLKHLKDIREARSKNKVNVDNALNTVKNIFYNNGAVTYSQINFIANRENISKEVLVKECEKNNFKLITTH